MIEPGYYSERIEGLEKREQEVTAQLVTAKLTLKSIKKEKEACYEYMNSAHYIPEENNNAYEKEIASLKNQLLSKEKTIDKMNRTINQKNGKIKSLNSVIEDKDHEISTLKLNYKITESKLQEKIAEMNIKNKKVKPDELLLENKSLKKENRGFKRDIKALNERIDMMDKTLQKKNKEIKILHERLHWRPVQSESRPNIFEEILNESD